MKPSAGKKVRVLSTPAEITKALPNARSRERHATKIRSAHYDPKRDLIVVELSTDAVLAVPRQAVRGFARVAATAISPLIITPGAEGLWSETADDGVLLEQLFVLAAGESMVGSVGARINASKKSPARAAASRANGARGGRPSKKPAQSR